MIGLTYCHIHTKQYLKLQIKKSIIPDYGKGLFAYGPPNEIIFKKDNGEIIDEKTLISRYEEYTAPYAIRLHRNKYEDEATIRGIGSIANHSDNESIINARFSIKKKIQLN